MVTIFTAVYNRCALIERLYESLERQTDKNFEWIIVDDGSMDYLHKKVIDDWMKEKQEYEIKYIYTRNGGKHRAINLGVKISKAQAFMIVDSDDYLTDDAVSFINKEFLTIADNEQFAGMSGLKAFYSNGAIMGGEPNYKGYVDATNLEREKYNLLGDKAEVYKTDILRKYSFPEYDGETFCGEGIVFNHIGFDGYKIRWFTKVLYMAEYMEDGLTNNMLRILRDNPKGWAINMTSQCEWEGWDEKKKYDIYFDFFEVESERLSQMDICGLLDIDEDYYRKMAQKKEYIKESIWKVIHDNNINSLALYGMGVYGRRMLRYLEEMGIEIRYAIDRNYKNIKTNYILYDLKDDIPTVDSICITLKEKDSRLEKMLCNKFPSTFIWNFADLTESD